MGGSNRYGTCTYLNPILHTLFRYSYFTCAGSSTIQVSSLLFNEGCYFCHIKVLFQMVEGCCHTKGGVLPVVGGGSSLMTHSAHAVTTQNTEQHSNM